MPCALPTLVGCVPPLSLSSYFIRRPSSRLATLSSGIRRRIMRGYATDRPRIENIRHRSARRVVMVAAMWRQILALQPLPILTALLVLMDEEHFRANYGRQYEHQKPSSPNTGAHRSEYRPPWQDSYRLMALVVERISNISQTELRRNSSLEGEEERNTVSVEMILIAMFAHHKHSKGKIDPRMLSLCCLWDHIWTCGPIFGSIFELTLRPNYEFKCGPKYDSKCGPQHGPE